MADVRLECLLILHLLLSGLRRCGKSCRLRWLNYLRPALRHGDFTEEEDSLILSLYGQIGSKYGCYLHASISSLNI
jgi:hypothetical protein